MASQPDAGAGPGVADHEHWFHALWFVLGPHGPQDVHYHPCCEGEAGECWAVIFGSGRDCGGREAPHERMVLTEDGPQPAEALARLRGTVTKPCGCGPVRPCDGHLDRSPFPPDPAELLARAEAAGAKLAAIEALCRTHPELAGAGYPQLASEVLAIIGTAKEAGRG